MTSTTNQEWILRIPNEKLDLNKRNESIVTRRSHGRVHMMHIESSPVTHRKSYELEVSTAPMLASTLGADPIEVEGLKSWTATLTATGPITDDDMAKVNRAFRRGVPVEAELYTDKQGYYTGRAHIEVLTKGDLMDGLPEFEVELVGTGELKYVK